MAIFATTIKDRRRNEPRSLNARGAGWRRAMQAAAILLPACALATPASAQTTGNNGLASGNLVLFEFLGTGGLLQPTNNNDGTQFVDFSNCSFGYIRNPYFGVVEGLAGTFGVTWSTGGTNTLSATHNVAGMLTFGNILGSSRFSTDDFQPLNGSEYFGAPYELYQGNGVPVGYGVWPLPGWWEITNGGAISYEYSAYTRIQVDTTVTNVLGSNGTVTEPQFINNVLYTNYDAGNNVAVQLQVRLYHATAQLRYRITNNDTAAHTVRLRFTVNVRPNSFGGGFDNSRTGYYFVDGQGRLSDDARVLFGADIPDQLTIYGKRYETDSTTDPPFAARHILRGFGATNPERVVLGHPFELRPNTGGFYFPPFTRVKLSAGVATGVYYGPYVLQPGQTQEVVTYYGNGSPTDLPNNDFVIAADGPEALAYNANAVNDPTLVGNVSANPSDAIPKFLSPNPFTLYGTIYNQAASNPQNAVNLTNVRASLTLPTGLALTNNDVAEKVIGTVTADRGSDVSWAVKPTADAYGTLAYLINFNTNEFGSRQVTRTINVPATPFRKVTANTFQMIGIPFDFDPIASNNADPATVVNGLTSPSDDPVIFFQYVPDPQNPNGLGQYVAANRLQNGIGYFYRPNLNRTIFAKGVKPLSGQAQTGITDFSGVSQNQRQIILEKGWNIISNPYVYDIPLRSLRFTTKINDTDVSSQTFLDAVGTGLIHGGVFFFNTSTNSYDFIDDASQPLKPWEGYWIYTTSRLALIYSLPTQRESAILPAPGSDPNPPTRGVIATKKALVTTPTVDNWRLQLVAKQGSDRNDRATIIGVNTDTNMKSTDRSLAKPPAEVSDYVYVGIVKPDNTTTRFAKDVRTGGRTNDWDIEVKADHDGPVTLTWPNIATLPRRVALTLKDTTTGRSYALRSSSSVTVNVSKAKPSRFVLTAKQSAAQPLVINNLRAIAAGSRGGGRSFAFNLSREASLTGKVKTITGKTVATLAVSRAASAGENRLQWNGRAQDGNPIPPGPYMIEIVAQDENGEIAPASRVFMTME